MNRDKTVKPVERRSYSDRTSRTVRNIYLFLTVIAIGVLAGFAFVYFSRAHHDSSAMVQSELPAVDGQSSQAEEETRLRESLLSAQTLSEEQRQLLEEFEKERETFTQKIREMENMLQEKDLRLADLETGGRESESALQRQQTDLADLQVRLGRVQADLEAAQSKEKDAVQALRLLEARTRAAEQEASVSAIVAPTPPAPAGQKTNEMERAVSSATPPPIILKASAPKTLNAARSATRFVPARSSPPPATDDLDAPVQLQ